MALMVIVVIKTKFSPQWQIQPPQVGAPYTYRWNLGFSICLLTFSLDWEGIQNSIKHLTTCLTTFQNHLKFIKNASLHAFSPLFSVCANVVKQSWLVSKFDTLDRHVKVFKLIRCCILQTWLIPGKLSIFPITGTLLKKLITTGKNPLKTKKKTTSLK